MPRQAARLPCTKQARRPRRPAAPQEPPMLTAKEIRQKYLRFFARHGHDILPSGVVKLNNFTQKEKRRFL